MKKFKFSYEEVWSKTFEVEAETLDEANEIASDMASDGQIEMDYKNILNFGEWNVEFVEEVKRRNP